MKSSIFPLIAITVLLSLGADKPKKLWDRDWDRKSFSTAVSMLALQAGEDGKVTDEELVAIATAGFRILEPEDEKAKLVAEVRAEGNSRVIFVAHDYGMRFIGYAFSFSKSGLFEKLAIVPSE